MRNKIFLTALTLVFSFSFPVLPAAAETAQHKNGVLVAEGGTIYLIKDNQRLGFATVYEFDSYGYTFDMIVPANAEDRKLPQGPNLALRAGSLVLDTDDGTTMYLIYDDGAHPVPSIEFMVFIKADGRRYYPLSVAKYARAAPVGFEFIYVNHPAGSLVDIDGTIYLITSSGRAPFPTQEVFFSYGYDFTMPLPATNLDRKLSVLPAMQYRDGTVINDRGTIYLISEGKKFGFRTWNGFLAYGYSPIAVADGDTTGYPEGETID